MKGCKYIILILLFCLVSSCRNQPDNAPYKHFIGIDLSHHNSIADWSQLSVDFIYLKATEGTGWVDPKFQFRLSEACKWEIPVGAYHFMTTASSAKDQFESFKAAVPKDKIDLIPVLDIERQSKGHLLSKKQLQQHVLEWCRSCKQYYGSYPIIYSSLGFYQQNFNGVLDHLMFWCGDVDAALEYVNQKVWVLWQHEINEVAGVKGKIDINLLNKEMQLSDIMLKK